MTPQQEKKFKSLCKQIAKLLSDMEKDHENIGLFIDDGTPYLIDCPPDEQPRNYILTSGEYWHRSSGGGF